MSETKLCAKCGVEFRKQDERSLSNWSRKKYCSRTCRRFVLERRQKPDGYGMWKSMKQRCSNPKLEAFKDYGARGISVCPEWDTSFETFIKDMGPKPSPKHMVERIDNDRGYEPDNCKWATIKEQSRNRRSSILLEYNGRTQTLVEWSEELGFNYSMVRDRIMKFHWPVKKAFEKPSRMRAR